MIMKHSHILIADDVSTARSITKAQLRKIGFSDITEVSDGMVALDRLNHMPVDLVIADWGMPNMNGLELVQAMKADERLKYIPIIMLSAESSREIIVQSMQAGVDGYILKPYTTAKLTETILKISKAERAAIENGNYLGPKPRKLEKAKAPVRLRPSQVGMI